MKKGYGDSGGILVEFGETWTLAHQGKVNGDGGGLDKL